MASAVLASLNEYSYMGKFPYSNPHLNPNPNPNSTSNSRSIPAKRKVSADHDQSNGRYVEEYGADVNQSGPDDASSFNHRRSYNASTDGDQFYQGEYISFDIASYRRHELVQLKNRFNVELDRIRMLMNRIESGEFQRQSISIKEERKVSSKKSLTEPNRSQPGVSGSSHKESKRFLLSENDKSLMKMCGQVLGKLMKHKRGYIFNSPVDVIALGLHDYHQIVKKPMDLGTVKMKLGKNMYETPLDFAADVRLTFENAMLYNPRGHDVHELAGQLLFRFDDLFRPIHVKCPLNQPQQPQQQQWGSSVVEDLQESSWNQTSKPENLQKSNMVDIAKKPDRMSVQETVSYRSLSNPPLPQSPVRSSSPRRVSPVKAFAKTKLPKPKAKDPNKREMSAMERHKLGVGLQSLPEEKMPQVVHIIKKRNPQLAEEGDEIELDIEALDTETLWELDRFVTNWKKLVSKINRQALMGNSGATMDGGMVYAHVELDAALPAKKAKKVVEGGEDDVDIGDDIPVSSFPPVEIEKDDGNGHATSSSSSSSSGSSSSSVSSSDSDSGSSSGSDTDEDNAQSKDLSKT